jgi:hypothetical protein
MPTLGARFGPHLERALQAARLLESPVSSLLHELLPGNQDIAPTFGSVRPAPRTARCRALLFPRLPRARL